MHTIYALKSHNNGLWYIGTTVDLYHRIANHRNRRPDLYSEGHTVKIIGTADTLNEAIIAEAQAIKKHNTLWPNGNNRCAGGVRGALLTVLMKENPDALLPAREAFHGDAIAAGRMKKLGRNVNILTEQERRRKAWKRKDQGMPPLPGTEYLLDRRPILRGTWERTDEYKKKLVEASRRYHKERVKNGIEVHKRGGMFRPHTDAEKVATATAKIKKRLIERRPLNYNGIKKAQKLALLRQTEKRQTVPGTEIFLKLRPPRRGFQYKNAEERERDQKETVERVNAWQIQYAEDHGWINPP